MHEPDATQRGMNIAEEVASREQAELLQAIVGHGYLT